MNKKAKKKLWNQTFFFYFGIEVKEVWPCVHISTSQSWKRLHVLKSNSGCKEAGKYVQVAWLQNLP